MDNASRDDAARWPLQLGRLMADSMIGIYADQHNVNAWLARELALLSPGARQIAEQEAAFVWLVRDNAAKREQRG